MLGAFAMWLISLDWVDKVRTIGILGATVGAVLLGIWLFLPRMAGRPFAGLNTEERGGM
jgi:DHA1 family bicyclomycin/chloramphenicol resistance-like MFS transporter